MPSRKSALVCLLSLAWAAGSTRAFVSPLLFPRSSIFCQGGATLLGLLPSQASELVEASLTGTAYQTSGGTGKADESEEGEYERSGKEESPQRKKSERLHFPALAFTTQKPRQKSIAVTMKGDDDDDGDDVVLFPVVGFRLLIVPCRSHAASVVRALPSPGGEPACCRIPQGRDYEVVVGHWHPPSS